MADGAPCGRQRRARAVSPRRTRTRRAVPGSAVALAHALAFPLVLLLSPARARAVAGADAAAPRTPLPAKRPHVVFVLVDDLGRGNAGWTHMLAGAQPPPWVKTPRLNDLAMREGRVLQRHYVHYVCTPTRSALQTGRFPVHVTTNLYNPENPAAGIPRNMTGVAEKLRDGGYATAFVGKWDAGMATPDHTPRGRGYESALGYFSHKNDYWSDVSLQTECSDAHKLTLKDLWRDDGPAREEVAAGGYEEEVFLKEALRVLDAHSTRADEQPLLLFYSAHVAHCPLQVPEPKLREFAALTRGTDEARCAAQTAHVFPGSTAADLACRAQYSAMANILDDTVGAIVDKLKAAGMWEDTLLVLSGDNGGPLILEESGATNWPLRGGKYTPWEGGVRAAAFVSGGAIPAGVRGTPVEVPIHAADWYATLCALAGVDPADARAAESGLPPVDGVDQWEALTTTPLASAQEVARGMTLSEGRVEAASARASAAAARRVLSQVAGDRVGCSSDEMLLASLAASREIPLDADSLLVGDLKLINATEVKFAVVAPKSFPNSTSKEVRNIARACAAKGGCLYDVAADPSEGDDIAEAHPHTVAAMMDRLASARAGFYSNDETGVDDCPGDTGGLPCACWTAVHRYGGFMGPYQK